MDDEAVARILQQEEDNLAAALAASIDSSTVGEAPKDISNELHDPTPDLHSLFLAFNEQECATVCIAESSNIQVKKRPSN
ncbi:hypothetical protein HK104_008205 [Borealophlyctis nickersoniae]|nr:hypothetical protein HK104_008205 [Borealophlyctis nickersoniae]